jgi:regulator of sigma E protease
VRIGVYFAGPLTNLLIGVLLYAFIVTQVGVASQVYVADVSPGSPAEQAGLQVDDIIKEINGQKVVTSNDVRVIIYDNLGKPIEMTVERGDQTITTSLVPRDPPPEDGAIGILMDHIVEPVSLWRAIPMGAQATLNQAMLILTIPSEIIKGALSPELARPVGYKGMYDMYEYVREENPIPDASVNVNVISFFAMISVSLGIFNLLPIPALDGGRILFALPEIIIRRRIPMEWQNAVNFFFFMGLILLFVYINILDFTNPIQLP